MAAGQVAHHRRVAAQLDQQVRIIGSEAAQGQALGLQIGVPRVDRARGTSGSPTEFPGNSGTLPCPSR